MRIDNHQLFFLPSKPYSHDQIVETNIEGQLQLRNLAREKKIKISLKLFFNGWNNFTYKG